MGSDWQPARIGGSNPTTGFGIDKSPTFQVYKKPPVEVDPAQQQAHDGPLGSNQRVAKVLPCLGREALFGGENALLHILCCTRL